MSGIRDRIEVKVSSKIVLSAYLDHGSNLGWLSISELFKGGNRQQIASFHFMKSGWLERAYPRISRSDYDGALIVFVGSASIELPNASLVKLADFLHLEIPAEPSAPATVSGAI